MSTAATTTTTLWRWSVEDLDGFWALDLGPLRRRVGAASTVLASATCPAPQWFPGTQLNYAEHAFAGSDDDALAIVRRRRGRATRSGRGASCASRRGGSPPGCAALGVSKGDRVAAYMPNIPETAAAFLATASLGAIWSSCSPDFGARSVIDRFAQIEPKVLLTVDGYRYGGRTFDRRDAVQAVREAIPGLAHTALLRYRDPGATLDGALDWDELTPRRRAAAVRARAVRPPAVGALLAPARPGCPRRSSRARAGSCSST